MRKLFIVLLLVYGALQEGNARSKKVRLYKATIIHFDNSKSKGTFYQVLTEGILLADAREFSHPTSKNSVTGVDAGLIKTRLIRSSRQGHFSPSLSQNRT